MIIGEPLSLADFISNKDHDESREDGVLTLADIDQLLEAMYASACAEPHYFPISLETAKFIWRLGQLRKLNEICPLPQRKLRKCIMRKVYARRRKAIECIRRKEQSGAWMNEIGQGNNEEASYHHRDRCVILDT